MKDENPRSSVMPRACDCGARSNDAVLNVVDSAFTSDVLPLSTWPMTPILRLSGGGSSLGACLLGIVLLCCFGRLRLAAMACSERGSWC